MQHVLLHTLAETFTESLIMLPLLFLAYFVIELVEKRASGRLRDLLSSRKFGVPGAALLGIFPQCGFSAAAANLYSEHLISAGALIAVFISTSDEAIPLLAANPEQVKWLPILIFVKLGWAIIAGYVIDLILREKTPESPVIPELFEPCECGCGCCGDEKTSMLWVVLGALKRTFSIFLFILTTSLVLHLVVHLVGEARLAALLMTDSLAQPLISALLGLIPSCAVSVVLTELFAAGSLSFGSLCAGLCSGAGVGLLVLFRSNRNVKRNFILVGLLWLFAALIGIILQLII